MMRKRRATKNKKRPTRLQQRGAKCRTAPRSLSVYDGMQHLGTIKIDGAGHIFASLQAAQAAFNETFM